MSLVALAAAILSALAVVSVRADDDRHTMLLTFNRPVGLPGVTLGSGTYVFELADPTASHDVIRVRSANRRQVYFTGFTMRVDRPARMKSGTPILIGETSPNQATPIRAWFPDGGQLGHEFIYR
jgi:hypothetical protein